MLRPIENLFAEQMLKPEFRVALLGEAVSEMISGELADGLRLLSDFGEPARQQLEAMGENPSARDLFQLIATLQRAEAAELQIRLIGPDEVQLFDVPDELHAAAA